MQLDDAAQYYDLSDKSREKKTFFFLENVLKARIELNLETGCNGENDEGTNVYVAGLLESLVEPDGPMRGKPYISASDADVRAFLEEHPGNSTEYIVYKENADFGLLTTSVFSGYEHSGSYHRRVLSESDESGRIALYYKLAGSALMHIAGPRTILVQIFDSMADHMDQVVQIVRKVAADYFGFVEQLSRGSIFHLEREMNEPRRETEYESRLDEFLRNFAAYKERPTQGLRARLRKQVARLKELNADFCFDPARLDRE